MPNHNVKYSNFHATVGGINTLATEWLHSANSEEDAFKSLIYGWIAFNAWGTSVTEQDKDINLKILLGASGRMNNSFANIMAVDNSFDEAVRELFKIFPIFDARAYRRKSAINGQDIPGEKMEFDALGKQWGLKHAPPNWISGNHATWGNCLLGIYQIRCNLFHGQKQQTSQSDVTVVKKACDVLLGFISKSNCFEWYDVEVVIADLKK